jgi:hypothetical protein
MATPRRTELMTAQDSGPNVAGRVEFGASPGLAGGAPTID